MGTQAMSGVPTTFDRNGQCAHGIQQEWAVGPLPMTGLACVGLQVTLQSAQAPSLVGELQWTHGLERNLQTL
jgi:hypothetical protein